MQEADIARGIPALIADLGVRGIGNLHVLQYNATIQNELATWIYV